MSARFKDAERARSYLHHDAIAHNTELPHERREASRSVLAGLEREDARAKHRAMVGTDEHFPTPRTASERAHQQRMREREEVTEGDARALRHELRGEKTAPTREPGPSRHSGSRSPAGLDEFRLPGASSAGAGFWEAVSVGIGLTLVYLVLSPRGSGAFSGLLRGVTDVVHGFIAPTDPLGPESVFSQLLEGGGEGLTRRERAVKIRERQSRRPLPEPSAPSSATVKTQRQSANPAFGPAPGVGTTLQPVTAGG